MKTSEALYAAADYIREYGFDVKGAPVDQGCPACFMGALQNVTAMRDGRYGGAALEMLRETIFTRGRPAFGAGQLTANGWNKDDAIAALEIAADIASAEGR